MTSSTRARGTTMRGALLMGPQHIEIRDLAMPRAGPGAMVIAVRAATTCGTDVKVYRRGGHPRMLRTPTLFGHEMAGVVVETGPGVRGFAPGDSVMVANSASCGALAEPLACVLHGLDVCAFDAREGAREVVVYGAGPIGLMFTAVLARHGQHVLLADPNESRLAVGTALGASATLAIERGGAQATAVREKTRRGEGADLAIECTGVPEVWRDAMESVRAGGEALLFGGCAPGSSVALDAHRVHYSELTVRGAYHHRPQSVRAAIELLADPSLEIERLLSGERCIDDVEKALGDMIAKRALKVVIRGRREFESHEMRP